MSAHRGARQSIARVTIEAVTPFTVGTGGGDDLRDSICVTDANGLPAIPGSSLAGVLRHALAGPEGPDRDPRCRDLFGYQERDQGQSSRLEVSWAQVHDEQDRPVPFRRPGGAPLSAVLAYLAVGVTRDHVRLNERGAVDDHGKFDETLVPAGARFTFELTVSDPGAGEMDRLLEILASPALRLGGRSRRGCGRFTVVRVLRRDFDLTRPGDRADWMTLPRALHQEAKCLRPVEPPRAAAPGGYASVRLVLRPEDYWLVGGGEPLEEYARGGKIPDLLPVTEARIVWTGGRAAIGQLQKLLPASAVKGALRHRVAFHARRAAGAWAPDAGPVAPGDTPPAVTALFGEAKDARGADGEPGRVFLSDLYLRDTQSRPGHLDHVCIDRFTAGPMDGMLFGEAPLFAGEQEIVVEVVVDRRGLQAADLRLLDRALRDLAGGRLALGGGANRGHGYFRGRLEPDDWLGGAA
jgi:CRISPR/Cas system CMR subunit Cmr4 (Cas7 group RAMP superfamily)